MTHEQQFSSNTKLRTIVFGHITDRVWRRQNYYRPKTDAEVSACPRLEGDPTLSNGTICFIDRSTLRDRKYDVFGVEPVLNTRFETAGVRHTLTLGTRYMTEGSRRRQYVTQTVKSDSGDLADDESHRTHAFAAYAQDRIAFRDWLLVTPRPPHGARRLRPSHRPHLSQWHPHRRGNRGPELQHLSAPRPRVVLGTPKLNAFAGFYQGFAPPRVSTAITNEGRDAQLGAEQSTNYELGVRAAPARWARVEATLFMMNFRTSS
ncbi:MAG: TonB-dependent receptor [Polyangiaceae bacterium]